jgi:hypothetical protein
LSRRGAWPSIRPRHGGRPVSHAPKDPMVYHALGGTQLTGGRLYCGHENAIEVLDIASPGYDSGERIKTTLTRRDKGGQKGAFEPSLRRTRRYLSR